MVAPSGAAQARCRAPWALLRSDNTLNLRQDSARRLAAPQKHRRGPSAARRGPACAAAAAAAEERHGHQHLYSGSDAPVSSLGFPTNFADKYELAERVGSGTFGVVHAAVAKETGKRVAVKSMTKRFGPGGALDYYFVRRVRNEVDIGSHLGRSLNVCYLAEAYEDGQDVHLVMELCTGGQLWDKIKAGTYSERQAAALVRQMLRAVAQCHAKGVMVRDIKPENFLFLSPEAGSPLKAVDFGISVFCQPGEYIDAKAGTPVYLAPEVLRQRYTLSADLWSVGIVAYQLLTGRLPFAGEDGSEVSERYMAKGQFSNKDVFRAVLYADLDFQSAPWQSISADARELVQALLQRDETLRPTAEQALQYRWLLESTVVSDAPLSSTLVQRLQRFGTYGQLKRLALRKLAHELGGSSAALAELRAVFAEMDGDGSGRVTAAQLRRALSGGRFDLSPGEIDQLLASVDADERGLIDYDTWVALMADWRGIYASADWEALVRGVFDSWDSDHDGRINAEELEAALCGDEGCEFPDVVEAALREADSDHDGSISLPEFAELLAPHADDSLELYESRLAAQAAADAAEGAEQN